MEKCHRKAANINKSDTTIGISSVVNDKDTKCDIKTICLISSPDSDVTKANKVIKFKLAIRMIGPMNDKVSNCVLSS